MLAKDSAERFCIAECLVHPWFESIRSTMWRRMDESTKEKLANVTQTQSAGTFASPRSNKSNTSGTGSSIPGRFVQSPKGSVKSLQSYYGRGSLVLGAEKVSRMCVIT